MLLRDIEAPIVGCIVTAGPGPFRDVEHEGRSPALHPTRQLLPDGLSRRRVEAMVLTSGDDAMARVVEAEGLAWHIEAKRDVL